MCICYISLQCDLAKLPDCGQNFCAILSMSQCDDSICFGNLHENTLQEIWNGPLIREFRRKAFSKKEFESIVGKNCNCKVCCYFSDSVSIHQVFKWINPFVRLLKS